MNHLANLRRTLFNTALVFGTLSAVCGAALAQPKTAEQIATQPTQPTTRAAKVGSNDEALCKRDIQRYVQSLGFLKIATGDKIADYTSHGIIDHKQLAELTARDGYCAVARVLKERKLI